MGFPQDRLRRLRATDGLRRMVRETRLSVDNLIAPFFVMEGKDARHPIGSMPGQWRVTVDHLIKDAGEVHTLGVPAVLLFGIPARKDEIGSGAWAPEGIVPRAVRALKEHVPGLVVITDVCVDEYTTHGHCGVVRDGRILNDETLECLQKMALSHARAGTDMVAPSDMMDGRVRAIREALDGEWFDQVSILSYAAKFASCFYAPFREAADSSPKFGDRQSYQMDPANLREALREIGEDIREGADIVMVKPALPYLDVVHAARTAFDHPIAVYQVSGEYSMIKAAAQAGWLDERRAMLETLLSIRRAGADLILTYFAKEAALALRG
jgi:porphobilinogen synthase